MIIEVIYVLLKKKKKKKLIYISLFIIIIEIRWTTILLGSSPIVRSIVLYVLYDCSVYSDGKLCCI